MHNPFAKSKPNPKRARPRRTGDRVRLKGRALIELRLQAFKRSGGQCEAIIYCERPECQPHWHELRYCNAPITWESMELSHKAHGPRKTDTLGGVIASCKECHRNEHNAGGKPVPRKPGRTMNKKEAEEHWKGTVCCFCKGKKPEKTTFCDGCWCKLSAQSRHDLLNTDCTDDYLQAVADAETELLALLAKGN